MWVAVGVAVAGVAGAVIGSQASKSAANTAADAQKYSADVATQAQMDMYNTTRKDFTPFRVPANRALATLQSSLYGGPIEYTDPSNSKVKLKATYSPTESEGFKYTKTRTLADLGRELRMLGRSNSTPGINARARVLGDLNVANEQRYKDDLWNLVKTGQGAAGSIASAGQNAANMISNTALTTGQNLANINLQQGQTQANLWGGLGGTMANAYGAYQMGKYSSK